MARRIVSWGGNEHIVSPNPLKSPSIVSVDSILQDKHDTSQAVQGTPNAAQSRSTNMASQVIELSGTRTWTSTSTCPGDDTADGLFVRHPKYFFKDGNVAFLVDNTLYCVHRYFFSRDSIYFSTRFTQLDIQDHEALPTIISLGDIEPKDFDAFLSVLYPENFEENYLCHEEWKSVLHLSTRWSFSSIRKLALRSIEPPTPYDRLILARTYSVHDWVVPALSALCERTTPLTLSEARQMNIEDVILISSVREHIRGGTIQVDAAEIPLLVEAEQDITLGHRIPLPSSRESEDDTPMAGAWHSRSRREKAEAVKAQVATRFRLVNERAKAEAKARQEAEKARLEAEGTTRKDAEEEARLEAEKERKGAEERVRLEAEKERKDAEKALAKKKAMEAAKKRKAEAITEADAKAKAAEAETKRQAELEAEVQAEGARTKAKDDEENKAKEEEEAKAMEAADRKADAKVIADAEAKAAAETAVQEAANRAATAEAEAAAAEEIRKEKQRQRAEKLKEAELQRVKAAEEQIARQRAADKAQKAARLAPGNPAASPISPRFSGGGWLFSKMSQAVSATVTPGQTDEPRSPSRPAATGSSDLFSRLQIKNPSSPKTELGPRNPSVMRQSPSNPWQSSSNPFRDPLSLPSATSGTAARSSASVLSLGTTLVSEEVSTTKHTQEGAGGGGKGTQAQTASETPTAPSAEQAGSDEAKAPPAEAIAAGPSTPDVVELTQTGDGAAQSAVPDASVEQSTGSGPISSEADNTQAPESTPPNTAAAPEARGTDPAASEAVNPDHASETGAPSSSGGAAAATNSNNPDPEAVAEDSTAQSSADNSHATGEGKSAPQGEDAKSGGPPKLTLPMDRVRQLSTAANVSSSSVEIPVDDDESPAVEGEEEGGLGEPGTPGKSKRKKRSKNKKKGEKNSPRPASGATGNDVDNPTKQDIKPVIPEPDPVNVFSEEGNGVLVEKADSSGDDSAVFMDAPQAVTEVEKAADATASGSDEWNVWS